MIAIEILSFTIALWLGMYLLARDPADRRLRWTSIGLFAYVLALSGQILTTSGPPPLLATLLRILYPFLLALPAIFWTRALLEFLPESGAWVTNARRYGLLVHGALGLLVGIGAWVTALDRQNILSSSLYVYFVMLALLPLLLVFGLATWHLWQRQQPRVAGLLVVVIVMFGLGLALPLTAWGWSGQRWWQLGLGIDLILLGIAIAALDAFDLGEAFLPDFVRALDAATLALLLYAGPVALTLWLATGLTPAMVGLLLVIIITAIAAQAFSSPLQAILDRIAFPTQPQLQEQRAALRTTAELLPKVNPAFDLASLDGQEFVRLTRRALTHYGDLPRLAASPLTRLPVIDTRLAARQAAHTHTLDRAAELKLLITELIAQLKPPGESKFDAGEAWRHYNALYFPYVLGLKPYSQRADHSHLDVESKAALVWFRTHVPERTLYNWQTTAARLIAQQLLELCREPAPAAKPA